MKKIELTKIPFVILQLVLVLVLCIGGTLSQKSKTSFGEGTADKIADSDGTATQNM
jgi:hypothetical protein